MRKPWTLMLAAIAVSGAAALPSQAHAQTDCRSRFSGACVDAPPGVYVSPGVADSADIKLTVSWTDDFALDMTTRWLKVNGAYWTETSSSGTTTSSTSLGTVHLQPGGNSVIAHVCDQGYAPKSMPPQCTTDTLTITLNAGPPPPTIQRDTPRVVFDPRLAGFRNVAASAVTLSYAPPAYTSLDAARSVGLFYASSQATPTAFVEVDATDHSIQQPVKMSLLVKTTGGVAVTPETFFAADHGVNRLAVQWDATSLATGAYSYLAVVRSYWSDGTFTEAPAVGVKALVLNQAASPFGAGWSAGFPRLYPDPGGYSVVIEDGGTLQNFVYSNATTDSAGAGVSNFASPTGDLSTLTYRSALNSYVRKFRDGTQMVFNGSGYLTTVSDRFANQTSYTWKWTTGTNPILVPDAIVDPAGKWTTFGYDASWKISTLTDPAGRVAHFSVNASGDLTQVTDPDGVVGLGVSYASHRPTSWWDRGSATTTAYYDYNNLPSTIFDPQVTLGDGSSVYPKHSVTTYETAVLPKQGYGTSASPSPRVIPDSVRILLSDPRNFTTRVAVNAFRQTTRLEGPQGEWTQVDRDYMGSPLKVSTSAGNTVTLEYDGLERVMRQTNLLTGEDSQITYNDTWNLPSQVLRNGVAENFDYESHGAVLRVRVGTDTLQRFTYDSRGRVTSVTDRLGAKLESFYATSGWMNTDSTRETTTLGKRLATFRYDAYGRVAGAHNPNGDTTAVTYDLLNRTLTTVSARGGTIGYTWGAMYLTQVTDPVGKTYGFGRNALGWLTTETDTNGRTSTYGYDASGNVSRFQGRTGTPVTQTFDAGGRVATRTADGATTTYTYDAVAGRWMTAQNAISTDTVKFDEAGRLVSAITVRGGHTFELGSTYDRSGVRTSVAARRPWSPVDSATYGYSPMLDLESVRGFGGATTSHQYDVMHRDTLDWMASSLTMARRYTARSELSAAVFKSSSTVNGLLGATYTYDVLSRIKSRTNTAGDSVRTYNYDVMGELTRSQDQYLTSVFSCTKPNTPSTCAWRDTTMVLATSDLTYDAVGNRTDSGATLETSSNRLATINGFTMVYDSLGNLKRKYNGSGVDRSFTWNSLGQLVSGGTTGAAGVVYSYDGFGRRVRRLDQSTGAVTQYLYDGDDLFAETDTAGNVIRRYTMNPGIDDPQSVDVRMANGTLQSYYYVTDASGNVRGLVDGSNNVVNRYRYGAFGAMEASSEGVSNPLRFKGRELDAATGLYYNRARWYDPDMGRFISEDPIGLDGGVNNYAFGGNDPINMSDPSGLACKVTIDKTLWDGYSKDERDGAIAFAANMGCSLWAGDKPITLDPAQVVVRKGNGQPGIQISNGTTIVSCTGGCSASINVHAGGANAAPSLVKMATKFLDPERQCSANYALGKMVDTMVPISLIGGAFEGAHAAGSFARSATAVGKVFSGQGVMATVGEGLWAGARGVGVGMLAGAAAGIVYGDLNEIAACAGI